MAKLFKKTFSGAYDDLPRKDIFGHRYLGDVQLKENLPTAGNVGDELAFDTAKSYGGASEESLMTSFLTKKSEEEEKTQEDLQKLNTQMQGLGLSNSPLHRMKQQRIMRKFQRTMAPLKKDVELEARSGREAWYTKASEKIAPLYTNPDYYTGKIDYSEVGEGWASRMKEGNSNWRTVPFAEDVWKHAGFDTAKEFAQQAKYTPGEGISYWGDVASRVGGGGALEGRGHNLWQAWQKWMGPGEVSSSWEDLLYGEDFFVPYVERAPNTRNLEKITDISTPGLPGFLAKPPKDVTGVTYGNLMQRYRGLI